jgi:3-methyladenine DNA glycosylase Tag
VDLPRRLKHRLVGAKWPAFEEVFHRFEPHGVGAMSDEMLEAMLEARLADSRLVRHWQAKTQVLFQ